MNYLSGSTMNSAVNLNADGADVGETPVLLEIKRAIQNHKISIVVILAVALAIGLVLTILATPFFTATTRIQIDRENDRVTNVESVEGEEFGDSEEFYLTQYAILDSRALARRVANSLNLANDEKFLDLYDVDKESFAAGEGEQATGGADAALENAIVDALLENHSITPVAGSSLVDIHFASPDRRLAAKVANEWARQFIGMNIDRRFASTEDARAFLTKRLGELRERMEDSERQLVTYADNRDIVQIAPSASSGAGEGGGAQATLVAADLRALNQELATATAAKIAAGAQLAASASNAAENPTLAGLRQRQAEVRSEYAKLLAQFEPEYPAAQALKSQIDDLTRSIALEERRSQGSLRDAYDAAEARESALRSRVNELVGDLSAEQRDSIQLNIYQREVDTNRALYDGLLQRYKEIGVAGVGSNNIAVIDAAEVPAFPSSPNLPVNLALALLGGLVAAGGFLFVAEHTRTAIREPSEVSKRFNIASLGGVPMVEGFDSRTELSDIKSHIWEAYVSIQTSLSFISEHGVPTSFTFTSTQPNEGKTTSSIALARVLAKNGRKVLLVDGDMRNPSLHKAFEVKNAAGLSNFLTGTDELGTLVRNMSSNLDLMSSGPLPPNAAQLLIGPRMSNLVTLAGEHYDHVIVDSPPVLGLADALLLGNATQGIIFTISANGASVKQIQNAIDRVRMAKVPILGAITTKIEDHAEYGYYEYYGYGKKADQLA